MTDQPDPDREPDATDADREVDAVDPDAVDPADGALLDELGRALGREPLPDGIVERAEGLATWFDVDRELTALLVDAADELAGTRGLAAGFRFLTQDGEFEIEIDPDGRRLIGHVVRGTASSVRLESVGGGADPVAEVDPLGRFELVASRPGPHRLRCEAAGSTVVTDWFVLTGHDDERT